MDERTITLSVEEYKKLLEAAVRIEALKSFVRDSEYRIEREDCGRFLGFEIEDKEDKK